MRLDNYSDMPSGMKTYLTYYGWHFSKKMYECAVQGMRDKNNSKVELYTKERLTELMNRYGMQNAFVPDYDALYVACMCKADFLGSSIRGEEELIKYVRDVKNDPDGYEGMIFTRYYADCIGSGKGIDWEDVI